MRGRHGPCLQPACFHRVRCGGSASRLTLKQFAKLPFALETADPRPKGLDVGTAEHPGGRAFLDKVRTQTERFESGTRRSRLKNVSPTVISRAVLELGGDLATIAEQTAIVERN